MSELSRGPELMEKIVSLCKRRGFVYPGSEIYGGLANSWDYGPLGVELKNNIKQMWWKMFVQRRADMVGIDAALLMNPKVWEATGHVATFSDPLVECLSCHKRYRADHLVEKNNDLLEKSILLLEDLRNKRATNVKNDLEERDSILDYVKQLQKNEGSVHSVISSHLEKTSELFENVDENIKSVKIIQDGIDGLKRGKGIFLKTFLNFEIACDNCGKKDWSDSKEFNMMLKTWLGPVEDQTAVVYLRPETAQAMFVDFKNILETSRRRLPFGAAQIGKAFRNEITPGNFIFRQREFEQMEIEYFIKPEEWETHFEHWVGELKKWLKLIGVKEERLHYVDISDEDRAFYSKRTVDVEYDYPFGQKELYGLAYRTDYDLSKHEEFSKSKLRFRDPEDQTADPIVPHVIEPSFGVDRTILVALLEAYDEEITDEEIRIVMRFPYWMAPVKVAILPLSKKEELSVPAKEVAQMLREADLTVEYDETQSIGKRYRRQDEIGTPLCVTFDFDSLEDKAVTIRDRDTMEQVRVPISELAAEIKKRLA